MVLDGQDFEKINVLSNKHRYKIFQLVSKDRLNITEITSKIGISYDRCREYITMLMKAGLVEKEVEGRETYITAKYKIIFEQIKE